MYSKSVDDPFCTLSGSNGTVPRKAGVLGVDRQVEKTNPHTPRPKPICTGVA